jgi:type VI secretion system protein VasD
MARWLRAALGLGLAAAVAACAAPPPPPPPTTVMLTLTATPDVNPTPDGKGAPVVLRVYQLASTAGFNGAEFFDLFNQDQATLKADLIKRDDVTLAPGQSKTLTLQPNDQVKAIGVFAGYRDYAHAIWRAATDVPPHKTTRITVQAGPQGIALTPPANAQPGS